jgi:hypothetical protein
MEHTWYNIELKKNGESKPTVQGFHQKVETSQQEASRSGKPPQ